MKQLRPYQEQAINNLGKALREGARTVMLHAPTGAGKTVIAAEIIRRARAKGKKVVFTAPAISLINQTVDSFLAHGITDIGVIQADHPLTNSNMPVQVCSVDSLARRRLPDCDLVLVDEAHRRSKFMDSWMAKWNLVPFIGLSATPWAVGLGKHYEKLIVACTSNDLIEQGYLSGSRVFSPSKADLEGVKIVAGDYHEGQLSERMQNKKLVGDIVENWLKAGEDRPTLCFCVDRAHARKMQNAFKDVGISCGYIDAYTEIHEREEIGEDFKSGDIKIVCNVGTLTTGIDWDVRCIILARPTKSEMLFVQIIGRALRTANGKDHALIFDHSDTHERLGMANDIHYDELDDGTKATSERKKKVKEDRDLPRECKACNFLKPPKTHVCPQCGFAAERQSEIECAAGELKEISAKSKNKKDKKENKQEFYSMLLGYAQEKKYSEGWAANKYREYYGVWPNKHRKEAIQADDIVRAWVRHTNIKWAKEKQKREKAA